MSDKPVTYDIGEAVYILRNKGGKVTRRAWDNTQAHLTYEKGTILHKTAEGFLVRWEPTQDDVLAQDYIRLD